MITLACSLGNADQLWYMLSYGNQEVETIGSRLRSLLTAWEEISLGGSFNAQAQFYY